MPSVADEDQKLIYPFHCCITKAKEVINIHLICSSVEEYQQTKKLLKQSFGQRHLIVRAMLVGAAKHGTFRPGPDSSVTYANTLLMKVP